MSYSFVRNIRIERNAVNSLFEELRKYEDTIESIKNYENIIGSMFCDSLIMRERGKYIQLFDKAFQTLKEYNKITTYDLSKSLYERKGEIGRAIYELNDFLCFIKEEHENTERAKEMAKRDTIIKEYRNEMSKKLINEDLEQNIFNEYKQKIEDRAEDQHTQEILERIERTARERYDKKLKELEEQMKHQQK